MFLLFPGRHIVNTRFQETYIAELLKRSVEQLHFLTGPPRANGNKGNETLDHIVYAITSANQDHSRYNPLPFADRQLLVYAFANQLQSTFGTGFSIFGMPDFGNNPRFASMTLTEIAEQSEGKLDLTPENTVVLCSTPSVIEMYRSLGFRILPAELESLDPEKYREVRPVDVVKRIGEAGKEWLNDSRLSQQLAESTINVFRQMPQMPGRIVRLYSPELAFLTETGDLTETRDYDTYAFGMGNQDAIRFKYDDIRHVIRGGRIVDEGCADGAFLIEVAKDFPDSDLIGLDASGRFKEMCDANLQQHRYGNGTYVHFRQGNIMARTFRDGSVDTTISMSALHELWSYLNQAQSVDEYFANKYRQTRKGGRIVIRDVVGPENKDQHVYMLCNDKDGSNSDVYADFADHADLTRHLEGLSTYSRFLRFSQDFLAEMRQKGKRGHETKVEYDVEEIEGRRYIVTTLKTAAEFMATKDYTDNWLSEMNEEFTYRDFNEHKKALREAGFAILENPNEPEKGSRAYCNPWMAENRFKGKVELYSMGLDGKLHQMDYPATNMVLAGEKR